MNLQRDVVGHESSFYPVGWHQSKRERPNSCFTEYLWYLNLHIFLIDTFYPIYFFFYEDSLFSVFIDFSSVVSYCGKWRDILNLGDLKKRCSFLPLGRLYFSGLKILVLIWWVRPASGICHTRNGLLKKPSHSLPIFCFFQHLPLWLLSLKMEEFINGCFLSVCGISHVSQGRFMCSFHSNGIVHWVQLWHVGDPFAQIAD